MILETGLVVAIGVAGYEYFTNKAFKAKVQADLAAAQTEVATLTTKAKSGVAVAEADFTAVVTALKSIASKL
jgi:hypothetical protein